MVSGSVALMGVGLGLAGVGLGISLLAATVLTIGAVVVFCNRERLKTICAKKELIELNDGFRDAIKYLNKAADLVRRNAKLEDGKRDERLPVQKDEEILNDFLNNQKKLWEPYTTAEGRDYTNKSEKDEEKGRHKSGLIKVSDEKTSTLGKMKLGIAKTWAAISLQ